MEPTFLQIREKDMSVKTKAISQLTEGQKALCMFRVFYDHADNSAGEYYAWVSYLLDKPDFWCGVTGGLRFFGDASMMHLLEETKEALEARNRKRGLQWSDAALQDLDRDHELQYAVNLLFERFRKNAPQSHKLIGTYIRSHSNEFVIIED
ncbi:hypothetical protein [Paenibacillus beijingensis]|nr:hypothetical protein [Paenibacillus beijingensis]